MLQEICEFVHNYFVHDRYTNTYTIANGTFSPTLTLKEGQRFLVSGSDLNDGIYTYHASGIMDDDDAVRVGLADEVFTGAVCGLAVPPQFVALSAEIKAWVATYGDTINSPLQSESFNGYSYSKAASANGNPGQLSGWQAQFASRLNRWRKVAF